jgi:hypothetical protein
MAVIIVGQLVGGQRVLSLGPAQVTGISFSIFFLAGVLAVREGPGLIQHPSVRFVSDELIADIVIQLSALTAAIVISMQFFARDLLRRLELVNLFRRREFVVFSQVLVLAAFVGAGITVLSAGGLQQAGELLRAHNKAVAVAVRDSVGIGLWKQFAPPSCMALSIVVVARGSSRAIRRLAVIELLVLVSVALVLFGSRLLVTQCLVGLGVAYCAIRGRSLRPMVVVATGIAVVLASLAVLGDRTSSTQDLNVSDIASVAGYDLLNVSVSSVVVDDAIRSDIVDVSNLVAASQYVVPFLGIRGRDLNDSRVDVIVARHIDGGSIRRGLETGFPPSLPTVLLICLGFWGALAASAALGGLTGLVAQKLGRRLWRTKSSFDAFWLVFFVVFVFNTFKDGDLLVGLAAAVRGAALLVVLEFTCLLLLTGRRRHGVGRGSRGSVVRGRLAEMAQTAASAHPVDGGGRLRVDPARLGARDPVPTMDTRHIMPS